MQSEASGSPSRSRMAFRACRMCSDLMLFLILFDHAPIYLVSGDKGGDGSVMGRGWGARGEGDSDRSMITEFLSMKMMGGRKM
eukprot:6537446-Karenia_brevis.AAC.1